MEEEKKETEVSQQKENGSVKSKKSKTETVLTIIGGIFGLIVGVYLTFLVGLKFVIVFCLVCGLLGLIFGSEALDLRLLDAKKCAEIYQKRAKESIESKIATIGQNAFSLGWKIGGILGLSIGILITFLTGFGLGKLIGLCLLCGVLGVVVGLFAFLYLANEYCIKKYGKILAFFSMLEQANTIKQELSIDDKLPAYNNHGDDYLNRLGAALNKTVKFVLIINRIIGFIFGVLLLGIIIYKLELLDLSSSILAWIGLFLAGLTGLFIFNYFAREYCFDHYGYLSSYRQLHININTIYQTISKTNDVNSTLENKDANIDFSKMSNEEKIAYVQECQNFSNFENKDGNIDSESKEVWVCPKCGASNPVGTMLCQNCEK